MRKQGHTCDCGSAKHGAIRSLYSLWHDLSYGRLLSLQDGRSGIAMEEFVEKSYLFDFYGELLTEHQRRIYSEINFDDYSAAEVARDEGISRQGVHDLMKRCDRILEDYEQRLHLVEKFLKIRNNVREIQKLTDTGETDNRADTSEMNRRMERIHGISSSILKEL